MTHRLTIIYAKNYCNRTLIVKVIIENVVTCFLGGTQCIISSVNVSSSVLCHVVCICWCLSVVLLITQTYIVVCLSVSVTVCLCVCQEVTIGCSKIYTASGFDRAQEVFSAQQLRVLQ